MAFGHLLDTYSWRLGRARAERASSRSASAVSCTCVAWTLTSRPPRYRAEGRLHGVGYQSQERGAGTRRPCPAPGIQEPRRPCICIFSISAWCGAARDPQQQPA